MNERIMMILNEYHLKKVDFAKRLKLSQPFVSELCSGAKMPSDRTISDICLEFQIDEHWLRTGEGDMKRKQSEDDAERLANIMRGASENKKQLIRILSAMPDELLDEMISFLKKEIK